MPTPSIARLSLLPLLCSLSLACDFPEKDDTGDTTGDSGTSGSDTGDSGDSGDSGDPPPVPTARAVDIVFVVDNSGSMSAMQARLAASIDGLVDTLDAAVPPVSYRIAVTTTDSGNPWCAGTSPENGSFVGTSCRSRTDDFVFNGAVEVDATQEACLDVCTIDDLGLTTPWIDVNGATGVTNLPGGDVKAGLACLLPQGINGCGFEQPLLSLASALDKAELPGDDNDGFLRPGALLAVALVTDEADCSYNPSFEEMFLPDGDRVFWSDLDAPAPTSAVCWNAGVACTGSGTYDECHAVDLALDGTPALDPADAVLNPIADYIDALTSRGAYVMAIDGVASDGTTVYADDMDPQLQSSFGIGAGCSENGVTALPPVRTREVIDTVSGPGHLHSACDGSYAPSLASMAGEILLRLP